MIALGAAPCALVGTGSAFPSRRADNDALLGDAVPERRRAGVLAALAEDPGVLVRARAVEETPVDLAAEAASAALAAAGVAAGAVAAHVHATSTPTRWTAAEAARIGQRLRLEGALLDVRSGCTGGLWALWTGATLARASGRPVLVTAADVFGKALPTEERLAAFAFGDGAAAVVLAPGARGIASAAFGGRPEHADLATVPASLPPRAGDRWTLAGDADAFGVAALAALREAVAAVDEPGAPVAVATTRAPVARAVAGARAWLDAHRAHGHLGAATPLLALHLGAGRPGSVVLASAGGGLSYGALRWAW